MTVDIQIMLAIILFAYLLENGIFCAKSCASKFLSLLTCTRFLLQKLVAGEGQDFKI